MATVGLEQVNKVYENGFHAVRDLDLEVADGEFMAVSYTHLTLPTN